LYTSFLPRTIDITTQAYYYENWEEAEGEKTPPREDSSGVRRLCVRARLGRAGLSEVGRDASASILVQ
tara:strand:- start:61 stop:264 length:204 start_codon:yes stop_codon:yes gene_type:complete